MLPSSHTESDDHNDAERDLANEVKNQLHSHSSHDIEHLDDVEVEPGEELEHGDLEHELNDVNAEEVVKPKKKALSKGVLIMGAGAVVMLGLAGGALYLKNDMSKVQRAPSVVKIDPSLTSSVVPTPIITAPIVTAADPTLMGQVPVMNTAGVDPLAPVSTIPVTGAPDPANPPAVDPLSNGVKISAAPNNPFDSQNSSVGASKQPSTYVPVLTPTPVPVVEAVIPKVKPVKEVVVTPVSIITEVAEPVVRPSAIKHKYVKPRVVKPSVVNKTDMMTSEKHPSQELNNKKSSETYNGYEKLF